MNTEIQTLTSEVGRYEQEAQTLVVKTQDDAKRAGDTLYNVKQFIKRMKEKQTELVKPFKEAIKNLEGEFKPGIERAEIAKTILDKAITDYALEQMRIAREEEQIRRQAEMLRLEAEKERLEEAAAKHNSNDLLDKAIAIEQRQETVMSAPSSVKGTVNGNMSITGISKRWDYEITDENIVPREYCSYDAGKLRKAVNAGVRDISGVRIFQKAGTVSR